MSTGLRWCDLRKESPAALKGKNRYSSSPISLNGAGSAANAELRQIKEKKKQVRKVAQLRCRECSVSCQGLAPITQMKAAISHSILCNCLQIVVANAHQKCRIRSESVINLLLCFWCLLSFHGFAPHLGFSVGQSQHTSTGATPFFV